MKIFKKVIGFCLIILILTLSFPMPSFAYSDHLIGSTRLAGIDRYRTAAAIAKTGWLTTGTAIIVSGENYPDALAVAPLAKKQRSPILLTAKDKLPEITKQTLKDLKVNNVQVIGGTGVISENVINELRSLFPVQIDTLGNKWWPVVRISGKDRYETATKIARNLNNIDPFGYSSTAFIVTGNDYADALSIAPVANALNAPILLVPKDSLPDSVKKYLTDSKTTKTYVVGDSKIISDNVFNQLPNPERIIGENKYDRNIAILNKFKDLIPSPDVLIASGEGYADAIAGTVLAAYIGKSPAPIILVKNDLEPVTENYLLNNPPVVAYLLGGAAVLPYSIIANLNQKLKPQTVGAPKVTVDTEFVSYLNNKHGVLEIDGHSIHVTWRHVGQDDIIDYYMIGAIESQDYASWSSCQKSSLVNAITELRDSISKQYPGIKLYAEIRIEDQWLAWFNTDRPNAPAHVTINNY